ncbi:MAG: hypothetical protein ABI670_16610 [Chloroflexota bacterium]
MKKLVMWGFGGLIILALIGAALGPKKTDTSGSTASSGSAGQSNQAAASVPEATQAPKPTAVVEEAPTIQEIAAIKKQSTDAQWDAFAKTLEGKRITEWRGEVSGVDQAFLSKDYRVILNTPDPVPGYAFDIYLIVPESEALAINKGRTLTVTGTIKSVNCVLTACPIELERATYR